MVGIESGDALSMEPSGRLRPVQRVRDIKGRTQSSARWTLTSLVGRSFPKANQGVAVVGTAISLAQPHDGHHVEFDLPAGGHLSDR